jgi:O-antigen/teichoic acid export membrane protein
LVTAIAAVVVAAVILNLLWEATRLRHHRARGRYIEVVASIRLWMLATAIVGLSATLTVYQLLNVIPALRYSWWYSIGGQGNILLGRTGQAGDGFVAASILLPIGLFLLVPQLALAEEEVFRHGTEEDGPFKVGRACVLFGLMHALVGVSLSAALALSVTGLVYHLVYRLSFTRPVSAAPQTVPLVEPPGNAGLTDWTARLDQRAEWLDQSEAWETALGQARDRAMVTSAAVHTVANWTLLVILGTALVVGPT